MLRTKGRNGVEALGHERNCRRLKIKVDCARRLARRGALTPNYRAESDGPFPIDNQLCQQ
jgi:hypothetical protein